MGILPAVTAKGAARVVTCAVGRSDFRTGDHRKNNRICASVRPNEQPSNGHEGVVGWMRCSSCPGGVTVGRQRPLACAARSSCIAPKISLGTFARATEIRWSKGTASGLVSTSSSFVQTVG